MKSINPYSLFIGGSLVAWMISWLFSSLTAGIVLGAVLATVLDPPILITGLVLGLLGNSYKRFAVAAYPVALIVGVVIVLVFINPWLEGLQRPVAGFWVYASKIYGVLLLAHLSHLIRDFILMRRAGKDV